MPVLHYRGIPCESPVDPLRIPCGFPADPLRIPCGSPVDPLRIPCGFPADSLRIPCGFPADSLRIPCVSPADSLRIPLKLEHKLGRSSGDPEGFFYSSVTPALEKHEFQAIVCPYPPLYPNNTPCCTVKYGYLPHLVPSKFEAKIRLMQISVEP